MIFSENRFAHFGIMRQVSATGCLSKTTAVPKELAMKQTTRAVTAFAAIVMIACAARAVAQNAPAKICPPGYSLVADVCISDKSGDVVLPTTHK
jgi:hypothetical protein